ncbi:MAG: tRNA (N6-isopentenyl adenosine(37)-C2)-methylthiotransferase MiaB [Firmicutes bacterium]|nr:tRNA (N6-isopentenyl adenosine(37)-C2)-methylthiotransferase MiaB [Bacillota bacterium]
MNLPNLKEARVRSDKKVEYLENDNNIKKMFDGKKYFLKTYGCQMNVHDSEEIRKYLELLGFSETDTLEDSDIVVLNTCAIRENAHDKVFGYLGRCKHLKKDKKDLIVAIGGCMSQEENVVNEIKTKHPYVDIVFGTHNINEFPKLVMNATGIQDIEVYSCEGNVFENVLYSRDSKIKAWVNIMYGCDKFCTYCIVPYTRGKQRSRKMDKILKEVQELKNNGYKEITLLGQNVNAYAKDLNDKTTFAMLLEECAKIGIERIRFVTSHPWDFTDEMIDIIAKYDNIMPYIHLPLQAGSSKILKLMGRRYTKEEYIELFNKIKTRIPNVAITTDIIVGFPNETEEEFNETLDVVNKCKYDGAYTFIYSPREGTPAALMNDSIDLKTKEERLYKLNEIINKYSKEANEKLVGKIVKVLIEDVSEKDKEKVFGYTDTMKLVNVIGGSDKIGEIVDVKITDAKSFSLDGEVL